VNRYDAFGTEVERQIRRTARQLVGRAGFQSTDRPDIEQELALDLVRRLPRLDTTRADRATFIRALLAHRAATLLEHRRAARRDHRKEVAPGEEAAASPFGPLDRGIDVGRAVTGLPPSLKTLCDRLGRSSVSEIARELGLSRSTVYGALARIRARFAAAGLSSYMGGAE
jgi:RNA polymerase sigma-70 factor (ECF subfamily)